MSDLQNMSIKEILDKTGTYTGLTSGYSMKPLLHEHKDNIVVVKNKGRLKKYDIPVYLSPKGSYIMHRIVEVHDDHYIIVGDNLLTKEYVTDDMICGVLVGFYKNGKHYVDCNKSVAYKIYSRIWVAFYPLRPLYFKIKKPFGWIKRQLTKRGDK